MGRSLRANVKSSMTHHSREQYVGPATTSSVWQPAMKMGKQASDCWMLFRSMHALSCAPRHKKQIKVRVCVPERVYAHVLCAQWEGCDECGLAPPARVSARCR